MGIRAVACIGLGCQPDRGTRIAELHRHGDLMHSDGDRAELDPVFLAVRAILSPSPDW